MSAGVGRCGDRMPDVAGDGGVETCCLPAGHEGWHRGDGIHGVPTPEWSPAGPVPPDVDQPVRIAWNGPADARVVVAGVDVAALCRFVRLDLSADEVPRLVLEMDPLALTAALGAAAVSIDQRAADVLQVLGWTPPPGGTHHIAAAPTGGLA